LPIGFAAEERDMNRDQEQELELADDAVDRIRADYLPSAEELSRAVNRGEITEVEADERLQAAARRHAAEYGPDLDTDADGTITSGGFGAGQGMADHSTGGRKARENVERN
jgi:hypothetical protein